MTYEDLVGHVDRICDELSQEPRRFADGGGMAVKRHLAAIEPDLRLMNILSDFRQLRDMMDGIRDGSIPRADTLARAHRVAYGIKISLGSQRTT